MNPVNVMNDIQSMLDGAEPPLTINCCIYKVPFVIRTLNEEAYTPNLLSIVPFHHRHPRLQNMQIHKLIFCKAFLQRAEATLGTLIYEIENIEPDFRRCYSETLEFTKEELVKIILVDSGFIIELFYRSYYKEWSGDDNFFLKPWVASNLTLDLLLLENQLPFFVIEKVFNLSFSKSPPFLDFVFDYFSDYNLSKLAIHNVSTVILHFTDLLRIFHLQHFHLQHPSQDPPNREDKSSVIQIQSATELLEAGVRFKLNTESKCLLDLKFNGRVLEIPQLKVEDWTETLFRNMVALEQCHYPYESYITDYVAVLDFLINTGRDVDILVNWLGDSDSVANMVNSLWKNVTHLNFSPHYSVLCDDLNAFYKNPWHNLKATLKRDYCKSHWQTAASIGILLLLLSLLQSVCSVLQVVQQYRDSSNTKFVQLLLNSELLSSLISIYSGPVFIFQWCCYSVCCIGLRIATNIFSSI